MEIVGEVIDPMPAPGVEGVGESLLPAAAGGAAEGMDLDVLGIGLESELGFFAASEDSNSSDTSSQSSSMSSSLGKKTAVPAAGGTVPPPRLSKTQYAAFAGVKEQRIIRASDVREQLRPLFLEQRPSLPQETADLAATLVQLQKESKRATARAEAAAATPGSGGSGGGGGSSGASAEGKYKTNWKNRFGSYSGDSSSSSSSSAASGSGASSSSTYYKLLRAAKQAAADLAVAESERGMADTPWRNCRLGALTILSLGDLAPSLAACARLDAQHFRLASKKGGTKSSDGDSDEKSSEGRNSESRSSGRSNGASAMNDEGQGGSDSARDAQIEDMEEEVVLGLPYFHTDDHLFPKGFKSSRPYWSAAQPLKRTLYVNEVRI